MKIKSLFTVIPSMILLFSSSPAFASLYDIVCVECSLTGNYEFTEHNNGNTASGDLSFSDLSSGFEIESFFGFPLIAHDVSVYWGPGTYAFDSNPSSSTSGQQIEMTVNSNQIGMHFLFDWSVYTDVDVINVFDVSYLNGDMILTSTDVDGNGIVGFTMVDGPFPGDLDMATNFVVATPIPAAAWLFGSGLIGLVGFARRK